MSGDETRGTDATPAGPVEFVEPAPGLERAAAVALFGDRLTLATRYATLLTTTGISHGLVGPREAPRMWSRHLLNCAALVDLLPPKGTLADVGSGAGLPGLVLAVARPEVQVTLIEPLERRVRWLEAVCADLALENATVLRARAEEVQERFDIVAARAVAPLGTLARWCLPLLRPGGSLLAMKGASASEELARARPVLRSLRAEQVRIQTCGAGLIDPPTTVVVVGAPSTPPRRKRPHQA
ncbi:MAG: 16S rRNA (guanine(527)-N(7))-methyltransferase RsmG [Dermatophilaceae bacterium]